MKKSKESIIANIAMHKVVVIIRSSKSDDLISIIKAVVKGGLPVIEVTYNTPDCLRIVQEISENHSEVLIGVGTVCNGEQAKKAIDAGANYLVTPVTSKEIVDVAVKHDVPVLMGAFSPTEIHQAHAFGADFVKLFPADYLGASYMKAVKATLNDVKFAPTGGITLDNCKEWIDAGASVLGIGSALISKQLIESKDYESITKRARAFKEKLEQI